MNPCKFILLCWFLILTVAPLLAAEAVTEPVDLSRQKVLFATGYSHLDTQWRWDYKKTIDDFLKATLYDNLALLEKYPDYEFNFTGAGRYMLMQEYYPEAFEKLKHFIQQGRWHVSGSSVDECDVLIPSPESVIRQVLYGNGYFRKQFDKESVDFMLPDCFGFPASMPSIWAHCGLKGFSTQKLSWNSAVGVPFPVGIWEGPDGNEIMAALDPGTYTRFIGGRVDAHPKWSKRMLASLETYGFGGDYHYFGVGDQGGAIDEVVVERYIAATRRTDGDYRVVLAASDELFRLTSSEQKQRLPRHKGDMLLVEHSAGVLTSQAAMKRWNRKNEYLAGAAERAAAAADWLGAAAYPREKLHTSWIRLLMTQMHDIVPGTSKPSAYEYSWNDEIVAMNGFTAVLKDSLGAISRTLESDFEGVALAVYNPLAFPREDLVEANLELDTPAEHVVVISPDGREVPIQILEQKGASLTILFPARVPSVGFAVYQVKSADQPRQYDTGLRVTERMLANDYYKVTINESGDVGSIYDKREQRQMLSKPARLEFQKEMPKRFPAWNMDWYDRRQGPFEYVEGPARIRIVEDGPVRVGVEIKRKANDSIFVQRIRLATGEAGARVEFDNRIDWQSQRCSLKAAFPLTVSNPRARYNLGLGTIERETNHPRQYEMPSREWIDLTAANGQYGVSVLEDCKYGSDKPTDNVLRLTLLHTPAVRRFRDQATQDWGRHRILYALYGHAGDWRQGQVERQGKRLNQPLMSFVMPRHEGRVGRRFSLASLDRPGIDIRAIKKAENSDFYIVRVQELFGQAHENIQLTFFADILEAVETDGQERRLSSAELENGRLLFDLDRYGIKTFALKPTAPKQAFTQPDSVPLPLAYNRDVISPNSDMSDGDFDGRGAAIPAEMLPKTIVSEGIRFEPGPTGAGRFNALECRGQKIYLPRGCFNRVYLLAAATRDTTGVFEIADEKHTLSVQAWDGYVGQFDRRIWDRKFEEVDYICDGKVTGIESGYIKPDPIAWYCTHKHLAAGRDDAYEFCYLYKYTLNISPGTEYLRLPDNPDIRILAAAAAHNENEGIVPGRPFHDLLDRQKPITLRASTAGRYITADMRPAARVLMEKKNNFKTLTICRPSRQDYADLQQHNEATFSVVDHPAGGRPAAGAVETQAFVNRLHDGQWSRRPADAVREFSFEYGEGRILIDLGRLCLLERINLFSWHHWVRSPQVFTVWAAQGPSVPDPGFDTYEECQWEYVASVDTMSLGPGGIHASSIVFDPNSQYTFRYILIITEDVAEGTPFTEIDVHTL